MLNKKMNSEPTTTAELAEKNATIAHEAARASRVAMVNEEIRLAKEAREKKEKEEGIVETVAVSKEREVNEKVKLAEADNVRAIELIEGSAGSELMNTIIARLNDVINYVNTGKHTVRVNEVRGMKVTDTVYYSETGRTSPDVMGEAAIK